MGITAKTLSKLLSNKLLRNLSFEIDGVIYNNKRDFMRKTGLNRDKTDEYLRKIKLDDNISIRDFSNQDLSFIIDDITYSNKTEFMRIVGMKRRRTNNLLKQLGIK